MIIVVPCHVFLSPSLAYTLPELNRFFFPLLLILLSLLRRFSICSFAVAFIFFEAFSKIILKDVFKVSLPKTFEKDNDPTLSF